MARREPVKALRKSALRREAILRNALRIFDRQGFANTSLDDIAKETGIKREAIYYYFSNRAEILLHIIRPASESLVEGLRGIVESKASFRDKLYRGIENHLERFDRKSLEMTAALRDVYLEDANQVRRAMEEIWRSYETMWTRLIEDGQACGEFAKCGQPKMVAFGILGMCNWLARWYDPKKAIGVDELIDTYFQIIAYGVIRNDQTPRALPEQRRQARLAAGVEGLPTLPARRTSPAAVGRS